uniref:Uncharacterized protein n=1 Tax=Ciona savignyi TaxID=51511 RepID=H2ZDA6_CIOSA
MQAHELMAQHRRQKWQEDVERDTAYSFKPKTHEMPDFEALHKQEEMEAFNRKMEVETTAVKPFNLRTSVRTKGDITFESLDGMDEPKWSTSKV